MLLRPWLLAPLLFGAAGLAVSPTAAAEAKPPARKIKPRVEVVFCLDTTGSMGGLIDGAKQKIWSLCNKIVSGKPTPDLKVGLVAYRDRGDAYVTKVTDLTGDLDAIHEELLSFKADGGGDEPESVNEALHVARAKFSGAPAKTSCASSIWWAMRRRTWIMPTIFLMRSVAGKRANAASSSTPFNVATCRAPRRSGRRLPARPRDGLCRLPRMVAYRR